MNRDSAAASVERIEELLYVIRGQRIMMRVILTMHAQGTEDCQS
jgi:hypothetical protein